MGRVSSGGADSSWATTDKVAQLSEIRAAAAIIWFFFFPLLRADTGMIVLQADKKITIIMF